MTIFYTGNIMQYGKATVKRHEESLLSFLQDQAMKNKTKANTNDALDRVKKSSLGYTPAIMTEFEPGQAYRKAENVQAYTALVLDLDDIHTTITTIGGVVSALQDAFTFEWYGYPTLSNGYKGLRYRVIVPLQEPINKDAYQAITTHLLQGLVDKHVLADVDISNKAIGRAFVVPISTPKSHADVFVNQMPPLSDEHVKQASESFKMAHKDTKTTKQQDAVTEPVKQSDFIRKVTVWAEHFPEHITSEGNWFATINHLRLALDRNEITRDEAEKALEIFATTAGNGYDSPEELARGLARFDAVQANPNDTGASYFDSGFYDSEQRAKLQDDNQQWYRLVPPKKDGGKPRLDITINKFLDYVNTEAYFMHEPDAIYGATILYDHSRGVWSRKSDFVGTIRMWVQSDLTNRDIIAYSTQRQREELVSLARTQASINAHVSSDPLNDNDGRYIAFANGTLDLISGRLLPHSRDFYIANNIPHDYISEPVQKSHIPYTMQFLESIVPADTIDWLINFIGSIAYTSPKATGNIVILNGNGANGKSTLLDHIKKMYGAGNISNISLDDLAGSNRFASSGLLDKMLNVASELSGKYLDDTSLLKSITGGDTINAEFKGKTAFSFVNHAKLLFATNKLPAFSDLSNGMHRRLKPINFASNFSNQTSEEKQAFKKLMTHVDAELELFLSYAIQQFMKTLTGEATIALPASMDAQLDDWFFNNDPIKQFAKELLIYDEKLVIVGQDNDISTKSDGELVKNVYEIYKDWSYDTGVKTISRQRFTTELSQLFETKVILNRTHNKAKRNVFAGVRFVGTDNGYVQPRHVSVDVDDSETKPNPDLPF